MAIVLTVAALCFSMLVGSAHGSDASAWGSPSGDPSNAPPDSVSVDPPAALRVLSVPYIAQGGLLCGGAALAMVLRYWGDNEVVSEDFADILDPREGIHTDALVEAAESRGWNSFAWHAQPDEVRAHLSRGRPVIALVDGGARTMHYVVLVAWTDGRVTYHDPARNPSRSLPEREFLDRWNASREWVLLVLPREPHTNSIKDAGRTLRSAPAGESDPQDCAGADVDHSGSGVWRSEVQRAVLLARSGDVEGARRILRAVHTKYPDSADPLRELAGLAFLQSRWREASQLAKQALERDPGDSLSHRILAASRFLDGDTDAALASWNRLQEPRLDLAEIQGSDAIRYRVIARQLGITHGELVTGPAFRQAERRLREIPAISGSRVSLVPVSGGRARLDVAIAERPLFPRDSRSLLRIGARSAIRRELVASGASLTGNGELWTVRGRWTEKRPLVALSLSIPNGGRPGIWRIDTAWERQAFRPRERIRTDFLPDSTDVVTPAELMREERRRSAVSVSDWVLPDVRWSMGVALDRWNRSDRFLALDDEVEIRFAGDRLAWTTWGSAWIPLHPNASGFRAGRTSFEWESSGLERADSWRAHAGLHSVSAQAPISVWPTVPSVGDMGRIHGAVRLRAHPRVVDDIVTPEMFGRSIWSGGIEKRIFPWNPRFLRVGTAAFVDAVGLPGSHPADGARWQVDAGVGLLLREIGSTETIRLDLAHGIRDGRWALSLRWQGKRRE